MTATLRRLAPLVLIAVLAAGCGATVTPSPAPSRTPRAATPALTPVPGAPSPTPAPTLPATTVTDFGKIWDALPPSWPTLPGQSQSEVLTGASEGLVVKGDTKTLAAQLGASLRESGWTVDIGSPLEDGSIVVDATHDPKGCKAEAVFSPTQAGSDDGTVVVYYGAACPFS